MMEARSVLIPALDRIRERTNADFVAAAKIDRRTNRIHFVAASGNANDRFNQMTKKPGAGVTGYVIRYGRPFMLDLSNPNWERERRQYPIMLAEQLCSVLAVPLLQSDGTIGVLIQGSRVPIQYSQFQIEQFIQLARSVPHPI